MKRIIVFGSGSGSNFEAIVQAIRRERLPIEVLFVFSENPNAFILERAQRLGIPSRVMDYKTIKERERYNAQVLQMLKEAEPWDLLVLAGYMKIIPKEIVQKYRNKIINIHPSLLPAFPGAHGIEEAFKAGMKVTGVTVHFVDEEVDTGPIIAQEPVPICETDTLETLEAKVHHLEHRLYISVIKRLLLEERLRPRALLSVSDKRDLAEFARGLTELGWEILSTGGTAKLLAEQEIAVANIESITGFPEILSGRVKTLHPKIFGGILALRDDPKHQSDLDAQAIEKIDLVCVNFYPFLEAAREPNLTEAQLIEEIDIGGPSLVRAAAKNFHHVIVLTDPSDYASLLEELRRGSVSEMTKRRLALKAFAKVAELDVAIYQTLQERWGIDLSPGPSPKEGGEPSPFPFREGGQGVRFPKKFFLAYTKAHELRYGENPHQRAALYQNALALGLSSQIEVLWGKELSYNNWLDTESALALLSELAPPASVIIKHNNPCGVARGKTLLEAYECALECDPVSAFGGVVALNQTVNKELARKLNEIFLEIIVAPEFAPDALPILQQKKDRRLLRCKELLFPKETLRFLSGDLLVQDTDSIVVQESNWKVLDNAPLTDSEKRDLIFAFTVCKHVKSNAIVVAKDEATLGIGAGQTNRVGSAKIALTQAGEKARGAVLASDGFFPFSDTVELAAQQGIAAIMQPGGSVRDEEVFSSARKHKIKMVLTEVRHFRH
jgi:phosphoribosylaminoimidazolecarboxamide formyltransferase/IMP cyclohydrolase